MTELEMVLKDTKIENNFLIKETKKGKIIYKYTGADSIVHIPEGIIGIGFKAFEDIKQIKEVFLPKSLKYIDAYAFTCCSSLEQVHFNEGLEKIETCAFSYTGLLKAILPDTVSSLGQGTFLDSSLEEVVISKKLKRIPLFCFAEDSNLSKVTIPQGVEAIGPAAFQGCFKLKNITLPQTLTSLGNLAEDEAFDGCVFDECVSLEKITIPSGVKNLPGNTFRKCSSLKEIDFKMQHLEYIDFECFVGCTSLEEIRIPSCDRIEPDIFFCPNEGMFKTVLEDFSDNYSTRIFCDEKTLEKSPEFVRHNRKNINPFTSIDDLITKSKSLKDINDMILSKEDR